MGRDISIGCCFTCRHARRVPSSRGAEFWHCHLSALDPSFPKYPRLPVLECRGYEQRNQDSLSPRTTNDVREP
jgi:hypothetical protein